MDINDLLTIIEGTQGAFVELSPSTKALCNSLIANTSWFSFRDGDDAISPEQRDEIEAIIALALDEINGGTLIEPPGDALNFFGDDVPTYDIASSGDGNAGTRFHCPDHAILISGVRYYRLAGMDTGVIGSVWELSGFTELGQVDFVDNTADSWVHAEFDEPIHIDQDNYFAVTVFTPGGGLPVKVSYFTSPITHGDLIAPGDGDGGNANGIFNTEHDVAFPSSGFMALCFFVDILYTIDD